MNVLLVHDGDTIPVVERIDPDGQDSYGFDWSLWLKEGEIITDSTWILPPSISIGQYKAGGEIPTTHNGSITSVFLRAAEPNQVHRITNRIYTSGERGEDRSFDLPCGDK